MPNGVFEWQLRDFESHARRFRSLLGHLERVDPELLNPVLLEFDNHRAAQKAKFRGELFPAQMGEGGSGLTFLEFFQIDKESSEPKGIVALDLRRWKR